MQFEVFSFSFLLLFLINVYVLSDDDSVVASCSVLLVGCMCSDYMWTLMFVAWNQFENESIYNLLKKVFMIYFLCVLYSDRFLSLDCNKIAIKTIPRASPSPVFSSMNITQVNNMKIIAHHSSLFAKHNTILNYTI